MLLRGPISSGLDDTNTVVVVGEVAARAWMGAGGVADRIELAEFRFRNIPLLFVGRSGGWDLSLRLRDDDDDDSVSER